MKSLLSVLVATDFSAEARMAAQRAASIGRESGLRAALVHVLPGSLPAGIHIHAAAQAQRALALVAGELMREGLSAEPRLLSGDIAGELTRASSEFDLVVAGARGEGSLLDFALGRTSVRLVRASGRPTLIVKRPPETPYRRVIAAVDFSRPSYEAAACGIRIAPKADFDLVHAFEVEFESALRLAGVEEDQMHAYRREARDRAMLAMEGLSRELGLPRERVWPTVTHGYPAKVIVDRARDTGAELVVIGKHAAGAIEHAFLGSVALQVLEMAPCDVLVMPESGA